MFPPEAVVCPVRVVLPVTERFASIVTSAVALVDPLRFVVPSKFTVVSLLYVYSVPASLIV